MRLMPSLLTWILFTPALAMAQPDYQFELYRPVEYAELRVDFCGRNLIPTSDRENPIVEICLMKAPLGIEGGDGPEALKVVRLNAEVEIYILSTFVFDPENSQRFSSRVLKAHSLSIHGETMRLAFVFKEYKRESATPEMELYQLLGRLPTDERFSIRP